MQLKEILEELNKYKVVSRNDLLYNKIVDRLDKSTDRYNKDLQLVLSSYDYTLKELNKL